MNKLIDYSNPKLEQDLKQLIGKSYGKFQPLIIDILLKRAYVFDLNDDQIINEAKRILDNLEKVEFIYDEDCDCAGYFNYEGKRIAINMDLQLNDRMVYHTFAHELFHVLSSYTKYYDNEKQQEVIENSIKANNEKHNDTILCIGIEEIPEREDSYSTGMMEAFNEAAASMIVNSCRDVYTENHQTYSTITFIPHLMSAAIGITDTKLLYAGIQSADKLNEIVIGNIKDKEGQDRVKGIVYTLDKTINMLLDNLKNPINNYSFKKDSYTKSVLEATICNTYLLADEHIKRDERHVSDEFVNELISRYNKMERVANVAIEQNFFLDKSKFDDIATCKKNMLNQIFGVYVVNSISSQIDNKQELKLYEKYAKCGKIFQITDKLEKKYNINLNEMQKNEFQEYVKGDKWKDCEYFNLLKKEDLHDNDKWNDEQDSYLLQKCRYNALMKKIIYSVKNVFDFSYAYKYGYRELMGMALGRQYNLASAVSKKNMQKELDEVYNIPLQVSEMFMENLEKCYKKLTKQTYTIESVYKEETKNKSELSETFNEYYGNLTSLIWEKNNCLDETLKVNDILSSEIGLRRIINYGERFIREYSNQELVSKAKYNKSNEFWIEEQIHQLYVLSKLKREEIYDVTPKDIEDAKNGVLFDNKEKFDFEQYFNKDEFEKDVKNQEKINMQLVNLNDSKISKVLNKIFKNRKLQIGQGSSEEIIQEKTKEKSKFVEYLKFDIQNDVVNKSVEQDTIQGYTKSKSESIDLYD